METFYTFFKISLPKYLQSLPIPKTFSQFKRLTGEDYWNLLPFVVTLLLVVYSLFRTLLSRRKARKPKVNFTVQKEDSKVVTQMDIEDIGEKIAFCRCWRSKKFPLCDGSHNLHNTESRDNVGPLLLRRAAADQ